MTRHSLPVTGKWHTFRLRLLKASWGIAIDLSARRLLVDTPPSGLRGRLADRLWLDVTATGLTATEVEQILRGLDAVAEQLETAAFGHHSIIEIRDVTYPATDYQAEGLAAAIIGWVSEDLDCPQPPIDVQFDRTANRYRITF
jgi:hypothetical protein